MSLINLLFRTTVGAAGGIVGAKTQLGFVTLDVAIELEHSREARVTEFPIEGGAIITDHVVMSPNRLKVSGLITDTPFESLTAFFGAARSSAAFSMLQVMFEARTPFSVYTPRQLYNNMVIERLVVPETKEGALRFECAMVEITTVFAQNAALPPTSEASGSSKLSKNGGGTSQLASSNVTNPGANGIGVNGSRVNPSMQGPERLTSWAKQISNGLGF